MKGVVCPNCPSYKHTPIKFVNNMKTFRIKIKPQGPLSFMYPTLKFEVGRLPGFRRRRSGWIRLRRERCRTAACPDEEGGPHPSE